jgi:hypothetical protein
VHFVANAWIQIGVSNDLLPYDPDDWVIDLQWIAARNRTGGDTYNEAAVIGYFERKYGPTADDHIGRVFGALKYFLRHSAEFDAYGLAIDCQFSPVMGQPLKLALLCVFNGAGEDQFDHEWSVDEVAAIGWKLAETYGGPMAS